MARKKGFQFSFFSAVAWKSSCFYASFPLRYKNNSPPCGRMLKAHWRSSSSQEILLLLRPFGSKANKNRGKTGAKCCHIAPRPTSDSITSYLLSVPEKAMNRKFENYLKCRFWILAFFTNFCPFKNDLSSNTVWPSFSFSETRQNWPFFVQNVNVARFARNIEWDFFYDFQTLCNDIIITAPSPHLEPSAAGR